MLRALSERMNPMRDTFLLPNALLFLILWFLSLVLFYYIIKVAVRNHMYFLCLFVVAQP